MVEPHWRDAVDHPGTRGQEHPPSQLARRGRCGCVRSDGRGAGLVGIRVCTAIRASRCSQERKSGNPQSARGDRAKQSEKFAAQSRRLQEALRAAYAKGFFRGQRVSSMPAALHPLGRFASAGMLVPTGMPPGLEPNRPRIDTDVGGYTLRWRGLALFASTVDPMSVWTRQALGSTPQPTRLGSHRVRRLTGPSGVIYAWPERGATYAVLTLPRFEGAARVLIASMR